MQFYWKLTACVSYLCTKIQLIWVKIVALKNILLSSVGYSNASTEGTEGEVFGQWYTKEKHPFPFFTETADFVSERNKQCFVYPISLSWLTFIRDSLRFFFSFKMYGGCTFLRKFKKKCLFWKNADNSKIWNSENTIG